MMKILEINHRTDFLSDNQLKEKNLRIMDIYGKYTEGTFSRIEGEYPFLDLIINTNKGEVRYLTTLNGGLRK